ncbi:AbrB/MazE/SpoVT family DNA-binding domain-containing protein [Bifidobacterium sp. ESL0690]|uniref:AbrB/MazE/SpoVT family DNA-binding domain-containing protein n=1 Tax=Bifidobacterium sp. ESL0690 TaxID=2983214 RepID=UPI0023F7686C|nr:AbrB/MazE/SpoVT family DNA-binding domain-containing protein [Bifidobacterium sp. ESL0690]WEV47572.1 AbrB/MazE/SpoVT family DNA-binding domain-containing protein [Bifidobacterium sp. ESL0690]
MPKVTVAKWGNSEGIRIPKEIRDEARISEGTELDISYKDGSIVLTPSTVRTVEVGKYDVPVLRDLFKGYTGSYRGEEWDTGAPVGKEIW